MRARRSHLRHDAESSTDIQSTNCGSVCKRQSGARTRFVALRAHDERGAHGGPRGCGWVRRARKRREGKHLRAERVLDVSSRGAPGEGRKKILRPGAGGWWRLSRVRVRHYAVVDKGLSGRGDRIGRKRVYQGWRRGKAARNLELLKRKFRQALRAAWSRPLEGSWLAR